LKKGFTLLELIIVIIILGVLATLGMTQYTKVVEKGRTAEARMILGQLRTAQRAYNLERGSYADIANLSVEAPTSCTSTHFFNYSCSSSNGTCTAYRCTSGGKTPNAATSYNISLDINGTWSGTPGYY